MNLTDVIRSWTIREAMRGAPEGGTKEQAAAIFDDWLEGIKHNAWEEGFAAGQEDEQDLQDRGGAEHVCPENPHRYSSSAE